MSNPIAEQLIEDLTYQKVSQGDMFTAFDITLFAKKEKGLTERHRNVKHVVHDLFVAGQLSGYDRTLIDIPGAPDKAYLYHPVGADITQYSAKDRAKFPDAGGSATATSNGITVLSTTSPAPATSTPSNGHTVDRRGRLCIPNALTRSLHWNRNSIISATPSNGGLVLNPSISPSVIAEYWLDKDDNIRISARTLRKAGLAPRSLSDSYDISISGSDIVIKRA